MPSKIVIVNQDSGYLAIDLVNAFTTKYDEVVFMSGHIVTMHADLNPDVKIRRITKYNRKSKLTRFITWLLAAIQVFFFLKTTYRKHELFVTTNPPIIIFILRLLNRPFSILVLDLYPDALVFANLMSRQHPIVRLWAAANIKILKKAMAIITLTPGMARNLGYYVEPEHIRIIPAWSSQLSLPEYENNSNPFIEKYQLQNKFIILYSGNLGKEHEVESLVDLAEELKEEEDLVVVIAGKGWKYKLINKLISKYKLKNCLLLPKQSADLFRAAIAAAGIGTVCLSKSVSGVSIPSKTFNLLAAGKPVLCIGDEKSDLADLLNNSKTGAAFASDKLKKMAEFIMNLKHQPDVYRMYSENSFHTAENYTVQNAKRMVNIHIECTTLKKSGIVDSVIEI